MVATIGVMPVGHGPADRPNDRRPQTTPPPAVVAPSARICVLFIATSECYFPPGWLVATSVPSKAVVRRPSGGHIRRTSSGGSSAAASTASRTLQAPGVGMSSAGGSRDDAGLVSEHHELGAVTGLQLGEQSTHMSLGGGVGDEQSGGDLLVGLTTG